MRKMSVLTCGLILGASVVASAQELPTTEELLKRIDKAAGELTTYSFETKYLCSGFPNMTIGSGKETGRIVRTEEGERHQFHSTWHSVSGPDLPGNTQDVWERDTKNVCDGETLWVEYRDAQRKTVTVEKHTVKEAEGKELGMRMNPILTVKTYAKRYDLSVTCESTFDGEATYVLAGKLRAELKETDWYGTCTIHVGKDDLFPRMIDLRDGTHGSDTSEFKNVQVGIEVDDELFEYEPPAGAKVDDKTKKE
jgi:outer membrane lipoprotein-sorting protein